MARSTAKLMHLTVDQASPAALAACRDLDRWPRSWRGTDADLPPGEALVTYFLPFIEHLVRSGLSTKTIRGHVNNLWLLGGELIRAIHLDPAQRTIDPGQLLQEAISSEGGPLLYDGSESEQRSFDSTCRTLHRFLMLASR